jgi:hypothetical protein
MAWRAQWREPSVGTSMESSSSPPIRASAVASRLCGDSAGRCVSCRNTTGAPTRTRLGLEQEERCLGGCAVRAAIVG